MNTWNDLKNNKRDKSKKFVKFDSISVSGLCRRERLDTKITVSRIVTKESRIPVACLE